MMPVLLRLKRDLRTKDGADTRRLLTRSSLLAHLFSVISL